MCLKMQNQVLSFFLFKLYLVCMAFFKTSRTFSMKLPFTGFPIITISEAPTLLSKASPKIIFQLIHVISEVLPLYNYAKNCRELIVAFILRLLFTVLNIR